MLDVGCGSSHIIGALPKGSVALDVLIEQAAVRAAVRRAARPRLRLRAAVCRRAASRACSARRSSSTCRWSRR